MLKKAALALALLTVTQGATAQVSSPATSAVQGTYPELPVGIKNGVGGLIGDTVYIGLGTAGQRFYALNLKRPEGGWQEVTSFPDPSRDQAAGAVVGGKLYVFGGSGKATPEATTAVFNQVHVYDPVGNSWSLLPTRAPREISGGAAVSDGQRILLFGGVNRNIFDGYFKDIAAAGSDKAQSDAVALAYFNQRPEDYFFGRDVQAYTPATNTWQSLGTVPFQGRAGATFTLQNGTLTIMGGEIKPGLRTAASAQGKVEAGQVTWKNLPDLTPVSPDTVQDGVAGAFAGYSGNMLLVAGGANFPGSTAAFAQGKLWAHQGLTKTWHDEIYALRGGRWALLGKLPQAQGYGLSVQYGNEVLFVGGELSGGAASTKVFSLEVQGGKLLLKD